MQNDDDDDEERDLASLRTASSNRPPQLLEDIHRDGEMTLCVGVLPTLRLCYVVVYVRIYISHKSEYRRHRLFVAFTSCLCSKGECWTNILWC